MAEVETSTDEAESQLPPAGAERRRRRWWGVGALVATGLVAAAWYAQVGVGAADETGGDETVELNFAEVVETDLTETTRYDGTLGRIQGNPISVRMEGTVTALPEEGTTLSQGDVVVWIDNQPVVLLYGELPAWREMRQGAQGPDVLQLETALTELGFNEDESRMTVDENYTSATRRVVEDWQESVGVEADGVVDLGEVIFLPGPVRVDALQVTVGDVVGPGTPVLTTSSDEIEVSFGLPLADQGKIDVGDPVEITLPDGTATTGVIVDIATVATQSSDGDAVFEVVVTLDDVSVANGIEEAPVWVDAVTDRADGVLAVPVEALLVLAEGGYAVEVGEGTGTRLVPVTVGFYASGMIEVRGDIEAGMQVVVP